MIWFLIFVKCLNKMCRVLIRIFQGVNYDKNNCLCAKMEKKKKFWIKMKNESILGLES